jgi:hypothetical protein
LWKHTATVARSVPLRVTGPPASTVRIFRTAVAQDRHVFVASARCATPCHAWISVSLTAKHLVPGQQGIWSANKIFSGTAKLGVWGPIPAGPVAVTINIGDGPHVRADSEMP